MHKKSASDWMPGSVHFFYRKPLHSVPPDSPSHRGQPSGNNTIRIHWNCCGGIIISQSVPQWITLLMDRNWKGNANNPASNERSHTALLFSPVESSVQIYSSLHYSQQNWWREVSKELTPTHSVFPGSSPLVARPPAHIIFYCSFHSMQ